MHNEANYWLTESCQLMLECRSKVNEICLCIDWCEFGTSDDLDLLWWQIWQNGRNYWKIKCMKVYHTDAWKSKLQTSICKDLCICYLFVVYHEICQFVFIYLIKYTATNLNATDKCWIWESRQSKTDLEREESNFTFQILHNLCWLGDSRVKQAIWLKNVLVNLENIFYTQLWVELML